MPGPATLRQSRQDAEHLHDKHPARRVLLVAPQPFFQSRGTPIAVEYVLRALSELGYSTDLLTYPFGSSPEIPGVEYHRLSNPLRFKTVPVSFSWRKVFLDILLAGALFRLLKRGKYHYVHAVEESALLVAGMRWLHQTHIVYDMASSLPEQLALKWYLRPAPVGWLARRIERWLFDHVDAIVASAGLRASVTFPANVTVSEWRFPAAAAPPDPGGVASLRSTLDIPANAKVILYTGTFETYQGVAQLAASVPMVLSIHPQAFFVLVGARSEGEVRDLTARIPSPCTDRVRILLRQGKDKMPAFSQLADVLVSPRSVGNNMPLKIFDYLAAAKPIVASDIPAHRTVLTSDLAVMVAPSAEGLSSGICAVLDDPSLASRLSNSARTFAQDHLSWKAFVGFIDRLTHQASGHSGPS